MIAECKELKRYSDDLQVLFQKYEGMGPVAGRQFLIVVYKEKIDGKFYFGSKSCSYNYPVQKGFVRG